MQIITCSPGQNLELKIFRKNLRNSDLINDIRNYIFEPQIGLPGSTKHTHTTIVRRRRSRIRSRRSRRSRMWIYRIVGHTKNCFDSSTTIKQSSKTLFLNPLFNDRLMVFFLVMFHNLPPQALNRRIVLQLKRLGNLKNKCNDMRFWEGDPID